jgi:type IV pilus assembly protein PilV
MVSLVILLFGLLGLAGMSTRANLAEMESYQRIKAVQALQDMADRLNANRKVANCYSNGATGLRVSESSPALPSCVDGNAQQQAQVAADLAAWSALLRGESETQSGAKIGAMIGAVGCVTLEDATDRVYMIAIAWQGLAKTAAPRKADGTAFPCGDGAFGDEKLHRVVTTKVRIGVLS